MLFESFLQNYIKNFEEQESNSKLMSTMKVARMFTCWKGVTVFKGAKSAPKEKSGSGIKVNESTASALNPHLEEEYLGLIEEFRKVAAFSSS
jgi:hypothetical protein